MVEDIQRKLAAIVSIDGCGYSRLMGADEVGTFEALRAHRDKLFDPLIAQHSGRIVKAMGDGLLLEFPSVVGATMCALAIQKGMLERNADVPKEKLIAFRIGINLGDVIIDGEDVHGDGVNIAARLQEIAEPGGICISDRVLEDVQYRLNDHFEDAGERSLKNITRPVRVWRWVAERTRAALESKQQLPLPDRPSIVVLPFNSLSSDPEQAFFADGIVEDLITALSRFPWLFVIARNTSFAYKGKAVSVRSVSQELGVRYLVEGSVRSSSARLRVSAQLIDAINDRHIWADNYDRPTGDLFDMQDEISQAIVGVLVPELGKAERERSLRSNRPNLGAWEALQKGLDFYYRPYNEADHAEARRLFDRAIELDSKFSEAYAMVALMGIYALVSGQSSYTGTDEEILAEAAQAARAAVQLEDNNALAHMVLGRTHQLRGDGEAGIAECETAIRLNPNFALAHHELGFVLIHEGKYAESVSCFDQAIRLSPNDPSRWNFYIMKGIALYAIGEFETSIVNLKEAARLRPTAFWTYLFLAGAFVGLGRIDEARTAMKEALARKPDCNVAFFRKFATAFRGNHVNSLIGHLKQVGLPD